MRGPKYPVGVVERKPWETRNCWSWVTSAPVLPTLRFLVRMGASPEAGGEIGSGVGVEAAGVGYGGSRIYSRGCGATGNIVSLNDTSPMWELAPVQRRSSRMIAEFASMSAD